MDDLDYVRKLLNHPGKVNMKYLPDLPVIKRACRLVTPYHLDIFMDGVSLSDREGDDTLLLVMHSYLKALDQLATRVPSC
jgi:hypothetical protein